MHTVSETTCTAFAGNRQIASGDLNQVALKAQQAESSARMTPVLIFDDLTGRVIEMDLRGTPEELSGRIAGIEGAPAPECELALPDGAVRGPGRPRLGVVAREVTLLPRHWDWLATQPGGASVALRKLVEEAKRTNQGKDRLRHAQEAAYRFMSAMAGNEPGFEEAARALFAGNRDGFTKIAEAWPVDVGNHAKKLALHSFDCLAREQTPL
jgi:hypothetical protein